MAGLWKLTTGLSAAFLPSASVEEHYLTLNDDGSFQAVQKSQAILGLTVLQGTWDYREDGQLILAADKEDEKLHDTVLEGKVQFRQTPAMAEALPWRDEEDRHDEEDEDTDTWLTVPKGSVQVGKFFYPKSHPAFFEKPINEPQNLGTFSLRQVLSNRPIEHDQYEFVDKYTRKNFTDRKFWLTSYPIPEPPAPKYVMKYGKYVQHKPRRPKKNANEAPSSYPIRVVQVEFFNNYTFQVTDGVGSAVELRGHWDIWGDESDMLWMQIAHFGAGSDVSGPTFSSGPNLSHDDAKWFRGSIHENDDTGEMQIKGDVYLGKDTPFREALFMMREAAVNDDEEEDDDDDDDDNAVLLDSVLDTSDSANVSDWSSNVFQ